MSRPGQIKFKSPGFPGPCIIDFVVLKTMLMHFSEKNNGNWVKFHNFRCHKTNLGLEAGQEGWQETPTCFCSALPVCMVHASLVNHSPWTLSAAKIFYFLG